MQLQLTIKVKMFRILLKSKGISLYFAIVVSFAIT